MATRIIQSPRRIQSPGVQITETDLTRRPTALQPVRPAAMVTGFATQGPTDEIVKITSMAQFDTVYGLPETAAERYLSHTVRQLVSTGSDVYVSRLPYGTGGGEDSQQNAYSALLFPVLPHGENYGDAESYYILPPKSVLIKESEYENKIKESNISFNSSLATGSISSFNTSFTLNKQVATAVFLDVVNELRITDTSVVNSYLPYSAYTGPVVLPNEYNLSRPLTSFNIQLAFNTRLQEIIDNDAATKGHAGNNALGIYFGAPTAWAKEQTDLNTLSSWNYYVSGTGYSSNINYTGFYHTKTSENNFIINNIDDISKAGIVVANTDKVTINDLFEGFYLGFADNSDDTPYTNFESIKSVQTVNSISADPTDSKWVQEFLEIPSQRLNFTLTEAYSSLTFNSVSERMARFPGYDFSQDSFNDSLKVFLFRLNTAPFLRDDITLNYSTVEAYAGSLYSKRQQNDPRGGRLVNFFVENRIDNNPNSRIKLLINPSISEQGDWIDNFGKPTKRVRVAEEAKALWGSGSHNPLSLQKKKKTIGDLLKKIDRTFQLCELTENESTNIDIICEAGLGTIAASIDATSNSGSLTFDGTFDDTLKVDITNLKTRHRNVNAYNTQFDPVRDSYVDVVRRFRNYVNDKKNCVYISDPLRYIFVNGRNSKVSDKKSFDFVNEVLLPLNLSYAKIPRSTYMTTYANWIKTYDNASDDFVWIPPSGFAGRIILNARKTAPWSAPAGFNYGRLANVADLAVNPNQRQRDLLYRNSYNPVVNFPRDGIMLYGQKTFINYQTAFDRLNVRNLFLFLEKETTNVLNRFVFEPNTISTRNRVLLRLAPIFERAKVRQGIFDYRLVCDERNNTPQTIDNNELRLAVYVQPVRSAEFILADFVAVRTGEDLDSLIS
jgi:hypothetical protein